jgi:hypothetical protein
MQYESTCFNDKFEDHLEEQSRTLEDLKLAKDKREKKARAIIVVVVEVS